MLPWKDRLMAKVKTDEEKKVTPKPKPKPKPKKKVTRKKKAVPASHPTAKKLMTELAIFYKAIMEALGVDTTELYEVDEFLKGCRINASLSKIITEELDQE